MTDKPNDFVNVKSNAGAVYVGGITVTLLSKWKLSSQLNKQPKRLKKNLKKFRLDQESNSDSCDDRTQR